MKIKINTEEFLKELVGLCNKYNIYSIYSNDDGVIFKTEWDSIQFSSYYYDSFQSITVAHHEGVYKPEKEDNND